VALAPPVRAQAPVRSARIGYLALSAPTPEAAISWQAFVRRLGELGWVEGRNLGLVRRDAGGQAERLGERAAELVRLTVDVIVASGISAVQAARRATTAIPIVIAGASDPVVFGLVQSLAHPGGNVTGFSASPGREVEGKRLELLRDTVPRLRRVALVLDSTARRDPGPVLEPEEAPMRLSTAATLATLALLTLGASIPAADAQVIFLVRHAEQSPDAEPVLTEAGRRRAAALAHRLKEAGITAIYATDAVRTRQTAEPAVRALGIELRVVPRGDIEGLAARLRTHDRQDRVLVVNHALNIQPLLRALGHPDGVRVAVNDYEPLLLIVLRPDGPPLVVFLRL
jgi:phosphohistidine phosphatase SixA